MAISGNPTTRACRDGLARRLKASFDVSGYPGRPESSSTALKRYRMLITNQRLNWYIKGSPNP